MDSWQVIVNCQLSIVNLKSLLFMLNIVIFGAPGSGKGTQSELIIKEYGLDHISTGDVLRSEMKNETELGKIAKDYIEKGQLVPDELIVDMLAKVLDSKVNSKGVIFDGFPRTIAQAEALDKALSAIGDSVDYAINVEVPDENIIERMSGRRACVGCGATYHIVYNPTKVEGKCDACGADLILRDDDKPETVEKRLNVYHEQTQPLIDYYKAKGILKEVDGTVDMKDVFAAITDILGE